jgi:hypothetical protein
MTGFQSKRLASAERHADAVTVDHIIDLRKRVALLEKQLEEKNKQLNNTLDVVMELRSRLAFHRI